MANYDSGLSGKHISANLRDYEAARSGFFTFMVYDIDNIIRTDYIGDRSQPDSIGPSSRIANAQEVLKLNVVASSVPNYSITPLEYKRGNDTIKFAGTPTFEAGEITVDDIVGVDTKSILLAWKALAYDPKTRRGGRMKDYKKTCDLIEYTQDFEVVRTWKLYGCWISDTSEDTFDKEADAKRKIRATIQYDRAEMELPKVQ